MEQQEASKRQQRFILPSVRTFRHAIRGIGRLLRTQSNARFHLFAMLAVMGLGGFFRISAHDWVAVLLSIGLVWTAEGINTSIEMLADVVSPEVRPSIRDVKDIAAGAVLMATLAAIVVGSIVFWPYVIG